VELTLVSNAPADINPTVPIPVGPDPTKTDTVMPPAEPSTGTSPLRITGFAALGVGAIGIGVGGLLWLGAKSKHDEAVTHCTPSCDDTARSLQSEAKDRGAIAPIMGIMGGVLAAGGVALMLFAPRATTARLRAAPWATATSAGVGTAATF
jgi:hypothetical protein